jgi:FAD dependent oxidoreductase TIGR03364
MTSSMTRCSGRFDLAVVGAGIIGLATALAAARHGLRVVVVDRDAQANGASIRNFGFITVTGQERGTMWSRARRSREVWLEIAAAAAVPILHRGLWMTARRPESVAVLEAFMGTEMAEGCSILTPAAARRRFPQLIAPGLAAVLESTIELRVESRQAIPRIAAWLAEAHGVIFVRNATVHHIDLPRVSTSSGVLEADRVAVCPGDDCSGLYAQRIRAYAVTRCKLQMLRLGSPGYQLPAALMSDLGLAHYAGYAALAPCAALRTRLLAEQADHVARGVHLIVVQSADGTLVVGDSHEYAATPDPFSYEEVDSLILDEFRSALGIDPPPTIERWSGTYASAADRSVLIDAPEPGVRIAVVTSGAGASSGFAIGEEVVASLLHDGATK